MISIIYHTFSACLDGFSPFVVRIECFIGRGLPAFKIVGLPDAGVKEAMDRIYSAIRASELEMPCAKVVVNLSPSDVRKVGTHLDLPICLALLSAAGGESGEVKGPWPPKTACFGELSLYGEVVPTPGLLPLILGLSEMGYERFIVPEANLEECLAVRTGRLLGVKNIKEALEGIFLSEDAWQCSRDDRGPKEKAKILDYSDVTGCREGKRAMEIAAVGHHHTLLIGPPGEGKTLLASRIRGILPEPTWEEVLAVTKIHNMAGMQRQGLVLDRPFRAPHYSMGSAAFIGGYAVLVPGEVSLAHNGVLFMDEMAEFKRDILESLRTLLDQRSLLLRRGKRHYEVPCDFLLIAATNPCPCGYYGSKRSCTCRESERERYRSRISGPVADRIDLKVAIGLSEDSKSHTSTTAEMKARVEIACLRQQKRNKEYGNLKNADLSGDDLLRACDLSHGTAAMMEKIVERLGLSRRSIDKVLRVARTISDLDEKHRVDDAALTEALMYNGQWESGNNKSRRDHL